MRTNSTLVVVVRIVAFVLLCLYSLLVFGQSETAAFTTTAPLQKFNGVVVSEKGIKLQWTLTTGNSAASITVEKGNKSGSFQAQAEYWVNMEGNFQTEFKWSDAKISKGDAFYRLRITDNKGNITYSNILQLNHPKKGSMSFLAPSTPLGTQTAKL